MTSWAPEICTHDDDNWSRGSLRFSTYTEAYDYAIHLAVRWTAVTNARAALTTDAISYRFAEHTLTPIEGTAA